MQEEAYANNPNIVRWTDSPENMKKLQDLFDELDARSKASAGSPYSALYEGVVAHLRETMPTRYEDPTSIFLLRTAATEVFNEITQQDHSFELPHLGTLPLGTLNARALPIPGSDTKLVVVNSSLFTFAHELGKIALATIPIQSDDHQVQIDLSGIFFQNSIRHDPQFLVRFSKALEDFANKRRIRGQAPPRELDDPLLVVLDAALEDFVLAHEFTHLMLHHQTDDRLGPATPSSISPDAFLRSWGEEAIADAYAAEFVNRLSYRRQLSEGAGSLRGELAEFSRYAPVLFFQLDQIAEAARYVHDHGELPPRPTDSERGSVVNVLQLALSQVLGAPKSDASGSGSSSGVISIPKEVLALGDHPPAWAREALMNAYWSVRMPSSVGSEERAFGEMAVMMGRNLEALWADLGPLWVRIISGQSPPVPAPERPASGTNTNESRMQNPEAETPRLLASRAWDEFNSKNYLKALIDADKAIDGGYQNAHFIRGRVNLALKNYRAAVEDFTAQIAYSDNYYWNHANRGIAYWHLGEIAQARVDFDAAIEDGGAQDASIRDYRGEFLLDVGDLDQGLVELRAGVSLAPDNAGIHADLVEGLVYMEKYESVPEASEALRNVTEGRPEREAYRNLGLMYETIALSCAGRDVSAARKLFEDTLKLSNVDWSFDMIDRWLSSSHCPDSAKALAKQIIDERKKLIQ
jgi:tetratricopeptide (TPR) repeat protein